MPGNHYSLLRQSRDDMNVLVGLLRRKLAPFGWTARVDQQEVQYALTQVRDRLGCFKEEANLFDCESSAR